MRCHGESCISCLCVNAFEAACAVSWPVMRSRVCERDYNACPLGWLRVVRGHAVRCKAPLTYAVISLEYKCCVDERGIINVGLGKNLRICPQWRKSNGNIYVDRTFRVCLDIFARKIGRTLALLVGMRWMARWRALRRVHIRAIVLR